jgi:hypothetical protein
MFGRGRCYFKSVIVCPWPWRRTTIVLLGICVQGLGARSKILVLVVDIVSSAPVEVRESDEYPKP